MSLLPPSEPARARSQQPGLTRELEDAGGTCARRRLLAWQSVIRVLQHRERGAPRLFTLYRRRHILLLLCCVLT